MSLYQLKDLSFVVGKNKLLDIDFLEIHKEKIYALLGSNGAGKTTLLNLLGFLDKPTTGKIDFMGQPVKFSEKYLRPLRRNVVMVNQRPILFSTSVYKNLEFGLKIRKIQPKARKQLIEENLELVGLSHLINAPAHKLSGGETQRIVLARALALNPKIILCDEPTSSVDLESQQTIIRLLKEINTHKKITVILTSHNQPEINTLAHHSFFIDKGKISSAGYENLFSTEFIQEGAKTICCIGDSIKVPVKNTICGPCRVTLDPQKISVVDGLQSSDESIKGIVTHVMQQGNQQIQLQVNCGVNLVVRMSIKQYHSFKPMVGEKICLGVDPQAVHIL